MRNKLANAALFLMPVIVFAAIIHDHGVQAHHAPDAVICK
jgi:hypothetical protein